MVEARKGKVAEIAVRSETNEKVQHEVQI